MHIYIYIYIYIYIAHRNFARNLQTWTSGPWPAPVAALPHAADAAALPGSARVSRAPPRPLHLASRCRRSSSSRRRFSSGRDAVRGALALALGALICRLCSDSAAPPRACPGDPAPGPVGPGAGHLEVKLKQPPACLRRLRRLRRLRSCAAGRR